jgi:hypothetical protein
MAAIIWLFSASMAALRPFSARSNGSIFDPAAGTTPFSGINFSPPFLDVDRTKWFSITLRLFDADIF